MDPFAKNLQHLRPRKAKKKFILYLQTKVGLGWRWKSLWLTTAIRPD